MNILDGKQLSLDIKDEIKTKVDKIKAEGGKIPHLAAVLIGDNPASKAYVRNKVKSCDYVGFNSTLIERDASTSEEKLLEIIDDLNNDDDIDGFIVQLPLPDHINAEKINLAIDPKKDVDGFHPVNFGRMVQGLPCYLPATPFGILTILERNNISIEGKKVVVLGRSNIVGTPMSILLSRKAKVGNATVTLCHSRTKNIEEELRAADVIIAAIGKPHYVQSHMVKEGAVIIDVGINRIEDATRKSGYRLVGDVDFEGVKDICGPITPVPGGVGPMTVTSLIMNTLLASKKEIYK